MLIKQDRNWTKVRKIMSEKNTKIKRKIEGKVNASGNEKEEKR
jgi:hypothetical protein